jgi:hypothetical protein
MTMGELIKRVNALTALDVQLAGRIKTALEKRNFLTHHFFREWAEISALPLGCQRMCIELENMEMLFKEVERDLRAAIFPVSRKPTGNAFVDSFNSAFDKAFKS